MILDWNNKKSLVFGKTVTIHRVSNGEKLEDCGGGIHCLDTRTGNYIWRAGDDGGTGSYEEPVFVRFSGGFMLSDDVLPRLPVLSEGAKLDAWDEDGPEDDMMIPELRPPPNDWLISGTLLVATVTGLAMWQLIDIVFWILSHVEISIR